MDGWIPKTLKRSFRQEAKDCQYMLWCHTWSELLCSTKLVIYSSKCVYLREKLVSLYGFFGSFVVVSIMGWCLKLVFAVSNPIPVDSSWIALFWFHGIVFCFKCSLTCLPLIETMRIPKWYKFNSSLLHVYFVELLYDYEFIFHFLL